MAAPKRQSNDMNSQDVEKYQPTVRKGGTEFRSLQLTKREYCKLLPHTLHYLQIKRKLENCSPVQLAVIPAFSTVHDVAVEACTGSGKTLAFLIPVVERLWFKLVQLTQSGDTLELPPGSTLDLACFGAVIIAPSRELVAQIGKEVKDFIAAFKEWEEKYADGTFIDKSLSKYNIARHRQAKRLFSLIFSGGRSLKDDRDLLNRVASRQSKDCGDFSLGVLSVTAGRLRSHFVSTEPSGIQMQKDWTFKTLEVLVIDEVDRFFNDEASRSQLMECLSKLPIQRRTGIFSATLTREYQSLEDCGLRNPLVIRLNIGKGVPDVAKRAKVESKTTSDDHDRKPEDESNVAISTSAHQLPTGLTNLYVVLEYPQRLAFLLKLLNTFEGRKAIVFFTTCAMVNFYHSILSDLILKQTTNGTLPQYLDPTIEWTFTAFHGQFGQAKRRKAIRVLNSPNEPKADKRILLASDLGARGLDFADIDLVVQFDPPNDPAMCIHRMGRTARAGKGGISILCLSPHETDYVQYLNTLGVTLSPASEDKRLLLCKNRKFRSENEQHHTWPVEGDTITEDLSVQNPRIHGKEAPLCDFVQDEECSSLLKWIKVATFRDKQWSVKAREAFVSMVRSYKEHRLRFIFVFVKLDYGLLANSLVLSRLPRMAELKGKRIKQRDPTFGLRVNVVGCPEYPFEEEFCMNFRDVEFHDERLETRHNNRLMKARVKRDKKLSQHRERKQRILKTKSRRITKAKKQMVNALTEADQNERERKRKKRTIVVSPEFVFLFNRTALQKS